MALYRIEVWCRRGVFDAEAASLLRDIKDLGADSVRRVEIGTVYRLRGRLDSQTLKKVAQNLFADMVVQKIFFGRRPTPKGAAEVEVWFKKGVTDTVGATALKGLFDMGVVGVTEVNTGRRYFLYGIKQDKQTASEIARRLLANEVIQNYRVQGGRKV